MVVITDKYSNQFVMHLHSLIVDNILKESDLSNLESIAPYIDLNLERIYYDSNCKKYDM